MRKVEISPRTIIFTVFFILGLYFLWIIQDLLFSLFIAFILMSALKPGVRVLERKGVPRTLAAVGVYFSGVGFFIYLFAIIVPPIIIEGTSLVHNLPYIVDNLNPQVASYLQLQSLTQYLPNVTGRVFDLVAGIFSNVFFVVTTIFFGFYFIIEENIIKNFLTNFFDDQRTARLIQVFERAETRMSAWFWGQAALMFIIGLFTFIGLNLMGMRYALALAVLAGLLEIVPSIGPILSAVPAFLIGFSSSYVMGVGVLALYFVIQQLENNLIVPVIMRRAVGLDPIVTLVSLLIGGKIGGILGILLSIPILLFISTFLVELKRDKSLYERLLK